MTDLAYLGTSVNWKPFKDKEKLSLSTNLLFFWKASDMNCWDREQELPSGFYGSVSWATYNNVWRDDYYRYRGWETDKKASRHLGTELNFEAEYKPVKNCTLKTEVGCFIPGQCYKDIEGMPNENTWYGPQALDNGNFGLGHDPVWRGSLSLVYVF